MRRAIGVDGPSPAGKAMVRTIILLTAVFLSGCGILPRNAVPLDRMGTAAVPGMPDVRAPAGRISAAMTSDMAKSFAQESAADFPAGADGIVHYAHLVLSGVGADCVSAGIHRG
jgi:hypothetical protein